MDDAHDSLVMEAAGGSPVAIEQLLQRHLPGLFTYVRLHLGAELSARDAPLDLVQSVCRDVLQNTAEFEFRGEGAFRHWLFRKAMATICDRQRYWRARKRSSDREVGDIVYTLRSNDRSPSEVAMREEDMQRLEVALRSLSEDHRQVVTLAFVVGLSRREIATVMNRSEAAVRSLLHRALARVGFLMSDPRVVRGETTV
ncbi:MAG: sigma-70 family RNA polymerase sigma factor [Planctomycetes bacterium]|nr:sigma-70 family RNA polymerase sigma factor [Planctomycetota bacterium]